MIKINTRVLIVEDNRDFEEKFENITQIKNRFETKDEFIEYLCDEAVDSFERQYDDIVCEADEDYIRKQVDKVWKDDVKEKKLITEIEELSNKLKHHRVSIKEVAR